jgi:hypothetical protein
MPRSGHHLLERILDCTLKTRFRYCEFYESGCCKTVPCTSEKKKGDDASAVYMQKSHDFEFADPLTVPATFRIVQYRSPVPRSLSNYELHLKNGNQDTVRGFRAFLVNEAMYFRRFYNKWLANHPTEYMTLSYEELTSHPVKATLDFFRYIGVTVDMEDVNEGVARAVGTRGREKTPFVPANVYAHRYASLTVLANFEDLVLRDCPGYYPSRYFPTPAGSHNSLIGLLYSARKAIDDGDYATALSLADAAAKQDPEDRMVKRIRTLAAAGGSAEPVVKSEQADPALANESS